MDTDARRLFERQGYKIVGAHSGVKLCHWLRQKLIHRRPCYKEHFYGIDCHRCLQMSPTLEQCNQNCLFCWRIQNFSGWDFEKIDEPEDILDRSIEAQKSLVSGFKGDERCDPAMWDEAREPNQVAISLTGEPTLYPRLGDFIEVCNKRGMTTFLVTNGTTPKVLEKLDPLPTQLYVTVAAPNPDIYGRLCAPMVEKGWQRLNQTLDILPSLDTRTVIRLTLVDEWNIGWEDQYSDLILKAEPDFVEPKAYVFVGASRERLRIENMPSHEKIREFGRRLANRVGYEVIGERPESRVVLLSSGKTAPHIH
ncbi:MAG: 4-demethylwyosine synthase TYW1 [Thermoplasmata archaeon]|nr:4-demethylwyosine synthase TYW1 [Thermoplasmata archaeon]